MIQTLKHLLKASGVSLVRIAWCDHANVIRAKATHIDHMQGLQRGVGIAAAQQALPVMFDAVAPDSGLGPVGEADLVPDWATLRVLPYAAGHALVLGDMQQDGMPWAYCPRAFLREQVTALAEEGIEVRAAFENEFFLLEKTLKPADSTIYAMTSAMNQHREVMLAIIEALKAQDIEVEYYYSESGPGQQELSMRYTEALAAADEQVIFRETVRGVAANHQLVASFLPKIVDNAAGSGCHINLSLWRDGRNITGDAEHTTGLSSQAQTFIAGVLQHLQALTALTIPSNNSFRRIRPHFWAGAFSAWGYGNREAAIRVTRGAHGASRFELKTADASANPYLALGGLLAAGRAGLKQQLPLPPEVTVDPGHMSEAERAAHHVTPLLTDFGEALQYLQEDAVLMSALGEARARAYLAVKTMEYDATKEMSLDEEVNLLAGRY